MGVGACGAFCCFGFGFRFRFRWHPRFAFVLQALPLCGAAPTFLCRLQRKVGKRKQLTPPARITAQEAPRPRPSRARVLSDLRCQRTYQPPHRLQSLLQRRAAANGLPSPGGKLCVGCRATQVSALTGDTSLVFQSGVMRVWRESLHTVCRVGTWAI